MKKLSTEYFELAKKLNEEEGLRQDKLHFRGNFGSCSLISLNPETPEEGLCGIKTPEAAEKALKKISAVLQEKTLKKKRGESRSTPEKELQAWIIESALENDYWLPFEKHVGNIKFVTSELVLTLNEGICERVNTDLGLSEQNRFDQTDIRNDILGIDEDNNLIVIELKPKRALNELCKQVNIFSSLLLQSEYRDAVSKVVKIMTGQDWTAGKVRKGIVWPSAAKPAVSTLKTLSQSENQITAIGYGAVNGSKGGKPVYSSDGQIVFSLETGGDLSAS